MNKDCRSTNRRIFGDDWLYLACFLGIPTLALLCSKVWKLWILSDGVFSFAAIYAVLRWECLLGLVLVLSLGVSIRSERWRSWVYGSLIVGGSVLWVVTCWEHLCYLRWGSLGDAVFLWYKARVWWTQGWDVTFPQMPSWLRWFWLVPAFWLMIPTLLIWIQRLYTEAGLFGQDSTLESSGHETKQYVEITETSVVGPVRTSGLSGVSWLWRWGILWVVIILVLPPGSSNSPQQRRLVACLWPDLLSQALYHRFVGSDVVGSRSPSRTFGDHSSLVPLSPSLFADTKNKPAPIFDTRYTRLLHTSVPTHRNVVLVLVDSMRMRDTTLYQPDLATTPFLVRLAKEGVWVERMYGVTPDPVRSMIAVLCGIYPRLAEPIWRGKPAKTPVQGAKTEPGYRLQFPARCLPDLLQRVGYQTAFFHGASAYQSVWTELLSVVGFGQFWGWQDMSTQGFRKIHRDVYEDRLTLEPALAWMEQVSQQGKPFFATLWLHGTNPAYRLPLGEPQQRWAGYMGKEPRSSLHALREQDRILEQIWRELRRRRWMKSTIFAVIGLRATSARLLGALGSSRALQAQNMQVPAVFYAPELLKPAMVRGLRQQVDVVPSLLSWLGFSSLGATWSGVSLTTHPLPHRILWLTGSLYRRCASLLGTQAQFMFYYYRKVSAWWAVDGANDPQGGEMGERKMGANERAIVLRASRLQSVYEQHDREVLQSARTKYPPHVSYQSGIILGSRVRVVGASLGATNVRQGGTFAVTVVFQALRPISARWRLLFSLETRGGSELYSFFHTPVSGLWPMSRWLRDEFVMDSLVMRVPAGYQSGDVLRLYVSISSKQRGVLPITFPSQPLQHRGYRRVLLMEFSLSMP